MKRIILLVSLAILFSATVCYANSVFFQSITIPIGIEPGAVAVGDVNGDGRNDVVVTGQPRPGSSFPPDQGRYIFVFLQNASGGLNPPLQYPGGNGNSLAVADINKDGKADVVVTTNDGIGVFFQDNSGGLNPMVTYPSNNPGSRLKVADLNNDGLLDVVVLRGSFLDVFIQNAGGSLTPVTIHLPDSGYFDLQVGDVNNDGLKDIIVAMSPYPHIGVLLQKEDGTFDSPSYHSPGSGYIGGVAVGDVNGDTLVDIVATYGGNRPDSRILVFAENNTGFIQPPTLYDSYDCPQPVVIADLNRDGRQEIIVAHGGWSSLGIYFQGNDGSLMAEERYSIPYSSHYSSQALAVGDINGDGLNDVLIVDQNGLVILYQSVYYALSNYFPVTSGYDWTYQRNDGSGVTQTVQPGTFMINGAGTKLFQGTDGSQAYLTNDGDGLREHREYVLLSSLPPTTLTFAPPFKYAEAQMILGQSLSSSGVAQFDISGYGTYFLNYSGNSTLQSVESVTVPKGTFEALRFQMTLTVEGYVNWQYLNVTENQTIWVAQNLGVVKQVTESETYDLVGTNFTPAPFYFNSQMRIPRKAIVTSNPITISGIGTPAIISIVGGEYSIDGAAYTANPGTVNNGQTVTARLTSSGTYGGTATTTLNIGGTIAAFTVTTVTHRSCDFDGDGKTDIAIYRGSDTWSWMILPSSTGVPYGAPWGISTDIPVPGDYDGDGKTDIAIYRGSDTWSWLILPSSTGIPYGVAWGTSTDIPVPGDYDGDRKTDIAIYHPDTGSWFIIPTSTGIAYGVAWGSSADIPVPGDYDGDGKTDIAIYHPGTGSWFIIPSSTGIPYGVAWGSSTDIPVPASNIGSATSVFRNLR